MKEIKTENEELAVNGSAEPEAQEQETETAEAAIDSEIKEAPSQNEHEAASFDYESLMQHDLCELIALFPHLSDKKSITELDNPLRYAALRDLGLSPKEAYLASSDIGSVYDNRSHLTASAPRGASPSQEMLCGGELEAARIIFSDLSDRDIQSLYKKVIK